MLHWIYKFAQDEFNILVAQKKKSYFIVKEEFSGNLGGP